MIYEPVLEYVRDPRRSRTRITPIGVYMNSIPERALKVTPLKRVDGMSSKERDVDELRFRREHEAYTFVINAIERFLSVRSLVATTEGTIAWRPGDGSSLPILSVAVKTENSDIIRLIFDALTPAERGETDMQRKTALHLWSDRLTSMAQFYDADNASPEERDRMQEAEAVLRILEGKRASPPKRA